jgi:hypothetical protein
MGIVFFQHAAKKLRHPNIPLRVEPFGFRQATGGTGFAFPGHTKSKI